jgi:GDP-4-dehydro-6-deoxy-D-mannose reductase
MATAKNLGTVVITGGAGFVGRYLMEELLASGLLKKIAIWDMKLGDLPAEVERLLIDITKPETYRHALQTLQPTWLVHLAAVASIPYAWAHPTETRQINVAGTRQLLRAVKELSPQTKVLVVSSADIYGVPSDKPIAELPLEECQPFNPYAEAKFLMEEMIEKEFPKETIRVRPFPHIGPRQMQGFVTADFASQIAAVEKGIGPAVMKVGNLEAQRDFTDVRDVVRAYRLIMEDGIMGQVYNVASGKGVKIADILEMMLKLSPTAITVEHDKDKQRPLDVPVIIGDAGKLKLLTGWAPKISLEQSLADILDYWRKVSV